MAQHRMSRLGKGILVLMTAAAADVPPAVGAPHAATAWIALPGFEAANGDSSVGHAARSAPPQVVARGDGGLLHFEIPVPRDRFGLLKGQVLMIRRSAAPPAADIHVFVGKAPAEDASGGVPWPAAAASGGDEGAVGLFRFPTRPESEGAAETPPSRERVSVWLTSPAAAALEGRYDFVLARVWDAADPYRAGPVLPTDGGDAASLLDTGMFLLFSGEWDGAAGAFEGLAAAGDPALAAAGRQCLRRVRAARAIGKAAENADADVSYDAALYAWANGFYDLALAGFRRLVELAPTDARALYHLAEMEERAGADVFSVAERFHMAGSLANADPNIWDVLVTILMEETTPDGKVVRMTKENIERIVREWEVVEKMVHGASLGHFKLDTTFRVVPDTDTVPYALHAGWLYGPADEVVPVAGMYDSCMSFRPAGPSVTGGADCGPNGAALVDIGTWCGWEVYLHEWNHQFDWGMITSEIGVGYPVTHDSDGCGPQPIPSMGAGHRASMRYYVTPAMYRRVELADVPAAPAIRSWQIAGPLPLAAPEGEAQPRLLDVPWTDAEDDLTSGRGVAPGAGWATWESDDDFIDLNAALGAGNLPHAGAYAQAFVYTPEPREVRLWLGHNDGMRVWVNGALIHGGRYFSIAKWEDLNRPDSIVSRASLEPGWNRIFCKIQKWDGGWGFGVRPCDFDGSPIEGIRFSAEARDPAAAPAKAPARGRYYRWSDVADDFTSLLPLWDGADLRAYTGMPALELRGGAQATQGAVALVAGEGVEPFPGSRFAADPAAEDDARLNNLMSWATEGIAALRFRREGGVRDLLLVRAESVEPVMRLLRERDVPAGVPGSMGERVLGYVMTSEGTSPRALLVAEAWLGDWPEEEEGLYGAPQ